MIQHQWQHVKLHLAKDEFHPFLKNEMSNLMLNNGHIMGYYDCQHYANEIQILLHRETAVGNLLIDMKNLLAPNQINNKNCYSIIYNNYNELSDLIAGTYALDFFINFSKKSLPFIISWSKNVANDKKQLTAIVFDLMVNHLLNERMQSSYLQTDYPSSFLSYRSHADGFFIRSQKEEQVRNEMEMLYQKGKISYHNRFKFFSQMARDSSENPLREWNILLNEIGCKIEEAIMSKKIIFNNSLNGFIADQHQTSSENLHAHVRGDHLMHNFVTHNKTFQISRLLSGILYLTLHRLGLSLTTRYLLCHIISRTIEDIYQITPQLAIKNIRHQIIKRKLKNIFTLGLLT